MALVPLASILLLTPPTPVLPIPHPPADPPEVRVSVDSSAHTVTLSAGPWTLAPAAHQAGHDHAAMAEMAMAMTPARLLRFDWPIDGWARGVRLELTDGAGRPLPRALLHHVNIINFARRQLLYDVPERLLAMGTETEDISLPRSIGVPVGQGMPMAVALMWHNTTAQAYPAVHLSLVIDWIPRNQMPQPVSVLPLYMNVINPVGRAADFDLPAGDHEFHADFTMPLSGRILGVGGHLHDYGTGVRLDEIHDGKRRAVVALGTTLTADGRIVAVERKYPGIRGRGIKLTRGQVYRMTGTYHNPTGQELQHGAMVHLIALFAPDDMDHWPVVDPTAPDFVSDVDFLEGR